MQKETKKTLRKITEETEYRLARSILLWKYKKEGKPVPGDHQLEQRSKEVADTAHQVVAKSGKRVWNQLKKVYFNDHKEKDEDA